MRMARFGIALPRGTSDGNRLTKCAGRRKRQKTSQLPHPYSDDQALGSYEDALEQTRCLGGKLLPFEDVDAEAVLHNLGKILAYAYAPPAPKIISARIASEI
jgi:hypothetical protein